MRKRRNGAETYQRFVHEAHEANKVKKTAKRKSARRPSQITGKSPSRRLVARRAKNVRKGYFPNPARKARTPAQRAATARLVALMKARRGVKRNPANAVPHRPRKVTPFEKYQGGLKNTRYRKANRLIGQSVAKYHLQVNRTKKWVTLAQFASREAALDYGRALQRKYKRSVLRIFW